MDFYKLTLEAIFKLLNETGVQFWADWILEDLDNWENNKSVWHHLSAYGGMGSFNDVVICVENNHKVTKQQETWVNHLLMSLQSLAYYLAKYETSEINVDIIKEKLKYNYSKIQGSRCLACGYSELSESDIDNFIAPKIISEVMIKALSEGRLIEFIDRVIDMNLPQIYIEREKIKIIIERSNINFTTLQRQMRPCPKCGSNDTAVYRWNKTKRKNILMEEVERLDPSEDNLPLRKK